MRTMRVCANQYCPNTPECVVCGPTGMHTGVADSNDMMIIMCLEENVSHAFLHWAFVTNCRVCEAAVSIQPVSHSLSLALVKESFLPDVAKCHTQSQTQGTVSVTSLFSGECFVTSFQFHLLEQLVNITPSENVKPFLFLFSEIHLFLEIYL